MITFKEALEMVESEVSPLSTEKVPLIRAFGRVMAADVISDVDMPPFNKAAMDGYACRKADLDGEFQIVEEIPAGKIPSCTLASGHCAKIMTGAMVPPGADFILMKEHAEVLATGKVRRTQQNSAENICFRGEDVRTGELVLKQGSKLNAARIAILASAGISFPQVYRLPRVAVISTGNELVEPDQLPEPGKIRNSNGFQLAAQALQYGIVADYLGIVADDPSALVDMLNGALQKYDLIMISGGVSVGDYDYIPGVLEQIKAEILFHGMQVKPGKHLLFARKGNSFIIGMPGNPVSSFVQFEVLAKPLLKRLSGHTETPDIRVMPVAEPYHRKKPETLNFIPVSFTPDARALPLEYHGSAHIHAYGTAQGIMEVPAGVSEIKQGDLVHVRPL